MTNLTMDTPRTFRGPFKLGTIAAPSTGTIYNGSAVQENSGQAENATGAGSTFFGIAVEQVTGSGAANDNNRVQCITKGEALLYVDATGAGTIARADVGATVYLTDGNTFTLDSTTAQAIGKVSEVPASAIGAAGGYLWVAFEGVQERSI